MTTYVLLKNKSINVLYGEDSKNETYNIYPLELLGKIEPSSSNSIETVAHSDVACIDTNIHVIETYRRRL